MRPGVSNSAKEKLQQNNNLFIQKARSSFIAQSTATAHKQAREAAEVAAMTALEARDRDALITIFQGHPSFTVDEQRTSIQKWTYKIRAAEETDNNNFLKVEQESLDSLMASAETLEDIGEIRAKIDSDPIYLQSDLGKRIKSLLEQSLTRKERTLVNRDENIFKDNFINQTNAAQTLDEVDKIYNNSKSDEHSPTLASDLEIFRDKRKKQIVTQNAARLTKDIAIMEKRIGEIGAGEIENVDEALAGIANSEARTFIAKAFSMGDGTRGFDDPEYLELLDIIKSPRGSILGFAHDQIGGKELKRLEEFLLDPNTSMVARFSLVNELTSRTSLDKFNTLEAQMGYKETVGPDKEPVVELTDWNNRNFFIDDFQREAITSISSSINRILEKATEDGDWTKSLLSPSSVMEIYRTINSKPFLEQFKKSNEIKTEADLGKKIDEIVFASETGVISRHYEKSIREQYGNLIYKLRKKAEKPK